MYTFNLLDKVKSFVQNIEPRKKAKKVLTKREESGILTESSRARDSIGSKERLKKPQKNCKNPLTNEKLCDIMQRSPKTTATRKERKRVE